MGHKQKRQLARTRHTIHALRGYLREADAEAQRLKDAVNQATDLAINRGREISDLQRANDRLNLQNTDLRRRTVCLAEARTNLEGDPAESVIALRVDRRAFNLNETRCNQELESLGQQLLHGMAVKYSVWKVAPR